MRQRQQRATIMTANTYRSEYVRHQERTFATEITAQGELRETMTALLESFVAGNVKPDRIHRVRPDYDPTAGTMIEHKESGRKGRQRLYTHTPRPLKRSDVITMKLHDRDKWNNPIDADGEPFKPFIRMTLADSGQIDFFNFDKPKKKAPTPTPSKKKISKKKKPKE